MAYYDMEDLVRETRTLTQQLKDIALSLEILSGRKTLKELRLEYKLESLRCGLSSIGETYPKVSERQQELLKEMDEVMEELRKERGEE